MTENSNLHNLRTYHFLFELCAILKFRQKKFYWLKWIFGLVFSLPLKASPGKNFFGPPPKKLVEKPFLAQNWIQLPRQFRKTPLKIFVLALSYILTKFSKRGKDISKGLDMDVSLVPVKKIGCPRTVFGPSSKQPPRIVVV